MSFAWDVLRIATPGPTQALLFMSFPVLALFVASLAFFAFSLQPHAEIVRAVLESVMMVAVTLFQAGIFVRLVPFSTISNTMFYVGVSLVVIVRVVLWAATILLGPRSYAKFSDPTYFRANHALYATRSTFFITSFCFGYILPLVVLVPGWERAWKASYEWLGHLTPNYTPRSIDGKAEGSEGKEKRLGEGTSMGKVVSRMRTEASDCCGTIGWVGEGRVCTRRSVSCPPGFVSVVAWSIVIFAFATRVYGNGEDVVGVLAMIAIVFTVLYDSVARPIAVRRLDPGNSFLVMIIFEGMPILLGSFVVTAFETVRDSTIGLVLLTLVFRLMIVLLRKTWVESVYASSTPQQAPRDMFLAVFYIYLIDEVITELIFLQLQPFTTAYALVLAGLTLRTIFHHGGFSDDIRECLRDAKEKFVAPTPPRWSATPSTEAVRAARATIAQPRAILNAMRVVQAEQGTCGWCKLHAIHSTPTKATNATLQTSRTLATECIATLVVIAALLAEEMGVAISGADRILTKKVNSSTTTLIAAYAVILLAQLVSSTIAWCLQTARIPPPLRSELATQNLNLWFNKPPEPTTSSTSILHESPIRAPPSPSPSEDNVIPQTPSTNPQPPLLNPYSTYFFELLLVSFNSICFAIAASFWIRALAS